MRVKLSSRGKWYWRLDYLGFTIGCVVAWAVVWTLLATLASPHTVHAVAPVFLGWVIGWITATIARVVYPAPKQTLITKGHSGQASAT
jgi:hypothetical protein